MKNIEKLKADAYAAMNAYQEAEAIETNKYNRTKVGKCFKYHNSGGGCDEKWWLYLKVLRVEDGNLRAFKFQQYANDSEHIDIEPNEFLYHGQSLDAGGGYTEIEPSEFKREWAKLLAKINGYSQGIRTAS